MERKEIYKKPSLVIFENNEDEIISTSNFGVRVTGDKELDYTDFWGL